MCGNTPGAGAIDAVTLAGGDATELDVGGWATDAGGAGGAGGELATVDELGATGVGADETAGFDPPVQAEIPTPTTITTADHRAW
jgi:hypothetical protein